MNTFKMGIPKSSIQSTGHINPGQAFYGRVADAGASRQLHMRIYGAVYEMDKPANTWSTLHSQVCIYDYEPVDLEITVIRSAS